MRTDGLLIGILVALLSTQPSYSQDVSTCDAALTKDAYYLNTSSHVDWRLATLVTSEQRQQKQDQYGVSAVIYGIPVGASYQDFQNNISAYASSHNESLNADYSKLIAWSTLDAAAPSNYDNCLKTIAASQPGLSVMIVGLTNTTALLSVRYAMSLNDKKQVQVSWLDHDHLLTGPVPTTLKSGAAAVYVNVRRPSAQDSFISLTRTDQGGGAPVRIPLQITPDLVQAPILRSWADSNTASSTNPLPATAADRYATFSVTLYADLTFANSNLSGTLKMNGIQYCGSSQPTPFGDLSNGHGVASFSCTVLVPSPPISVQVNADYGGKGSVTLIHTAVTVN